MALTCSHFLLLPAKLKPSSSVVRNLVLVDVTDGSAPADSSILVHNVPPLVNEKNLTAAFERIAPVHSVTFVTNEKSSFGRSLLIGYHKAIVQFKKSQD